MLFHYASALLSIETIESQHSSLNWHLLKVHYNYQKRKRHPFVDDDFDENLNERSIIYCHKNKIFY